MSVDCWSSYNNWTSPEFSCPSRSEWVSHDDGTDRPLQEELRMARDQWFSVVMWPSASPFGESVGEVDTPVAHGTTLDFSPPLREIGVEAGTSVGVCDEHGRGSCRERVCQ